MIAILERGKRKRRRKKNRGGLKDSHVVIAGWRCTLMSHDFVVQFHIVEG